MQLALKDIIRVILLRAETFETCVSVLIPKHWPMAELRSASPVETTVYKMILLHTLITSWKSAEDKLNKADDIPVSATYTSWEFYNAKK